MAKSSPADLSGPIRLAQRAKDQFDKLNAKASRFVEEHPCSVYSDRQGDIWAVRVRVTEQPPDEWSLDVGELANNARSALDHLVYQLAIDSGSNPAGKRTQFPIFEVQDHYTGKGQPGRSWRDKMLDGVARKHRRVIDELQPWKRGHRASDDPLAILRSITDRHKHRELHTGITFLESLTVKIIWTEEVEGELEIAYTDQTDPLRDGQPVCELSNTPQPDPNVEVPPNTKLPTDFAVPVPARFSVAFTGDRMIRMLDLERSINHAQGIIQRFHNRITH